MVFADESQKNDAEFFSINNDIETLILYVDLCVCNSCIGKELGFFIT